MALLPNRPNNIGPVAKLTKRFEDICQLGILTVEFSEEFSLKDCMDITSVKYMYGIVYSELNKTQAPSDRLSLECWLNVAKFLKDQGKGKKNLCIKTFRY